MTVGMRLKALLLSTGLLLLSAPLHAAGDGGVDTDGLAQAADTGKNCLGQGKAKATLGSILGLAYGPLGIEHRLRIGVCTPFSKKPGILHELSFFEAGFQQHTSPIYLMPGGYLVFAPLSFLVFNAEVAPILYWPIGLEGAGYYPLGGYESDYRSEALPGDAGAEAQGWYLRGGMTLQLAASIGPVRLIVLDSLQLERWVLGESEHYYHNRNDLPAANPESFIDNNAIVMVEIPLRPNINLRLGVNDQLVMNLGARQISNTLAGVAMVHFERVGERIHDLTPIFRIGGRTHHPVRQGEISIIVALTFSADLSPRSSDSAAPSSAELT